jgi:hypothetical protein
MLHLGNCEVLNSAPVIVFGKNVNNTGYRNAFMGYTDNFFFVIGDYGNTNAGANALTSQLAVLYSAPASSLVIQGSGYVQMPYGSGTGSDERIRQIALFSRNSCIFPKLLQTFWKNASIFTIFLEKRFLQIPDFLFFFRR